MSFLVLIALAILLYPINPRAIPFEEEKVEQWLLRIRRGAWGFVIVTCFIRLIPQ